jgi:hypothetical protein
VILLHVTKRRAIARSLARADPEDVEAVFQALEALGDEPSEGWLFARTNELRPASAEDRIVVPEGPPNPWSGRTVVVTGEDELAVALVEKNEPESVLAGRLVRPVPVPRFRGRSGKVRNLFHPQALIRKSSALADALRAICPRHPAELLAFLLCPGGWSHEFEPIEQIRLGTPPVWIQGPVSRTCPRCKERMRVALQLPGFPLREKTWADTTFYVLACPEHPEELQVVRQMT